MTGSPEHFRLQPRSYASSAEVNLLDVTFRDGGFAVDFRWPHPVVHAATRALDRLNVSAIELGYIGGLPELHSVRAAGTSADLQPSDIASLRPQQIELAAMIHPSATGAQDLDFGAYARAGVGLVRLVYHETWRDRVTALAADACEAGLRVSVNMALASRYERHELQAQAAWLIEHARPDLLYVADTCGALFPRDVRSLLEPLASGSCEIGFHAHDFLSLAFANSLAAVEAGATFIDASLLGLGRATGNLRTELWLTTGEPRCHPWNLGQLARVLDLIHAADPHPAVATFSLACAALNLTPPEEDLLHEVAAAVGQDAVEVALAVASRPLPPGTPFTAESLAPLLDSASARS
jgi:4-hydroxy 2-oxovalerate aldolase